MSQTAPVMRTPGKAPLPGPMDEEGGKSTQAATPGTLKKKRKRNMRLPINVALVRRSRSCCSVVCLDGRMASDCNLLDMKI